MYSEKWKLHFKEIKKNIIFLKAGVHLHKWVERWKWSKMFFQNTNVLAIQLKHFVKLWSHLNMGSPWRSCQYQPVSFRHSYETDMQDFSRESQTFPLHSLVGGLHTFCASRNSHLMGILVLCQKLRGVGTAVLVFCAKLFLWELTSTL